MGTRDQIRDLVLDDDVDLFTDAPAWVVGARLGYEIALLGAAVASAWLLIVEARWAGPAAWALWAWFAADYCIRLGVANDRKAYVRAHRLELLAALPVDFFRPLRAIRLLRPLAMVARSTKGLRDVLGLRGIPLLVGIGVSVVWVGGALFVRFEGGDLDVADGIWWAIVTTTTVGYGDISPASTEGRVLAGALMVIGIGLLGGLTAEIAQRLIVDRSAPSSGDPEIDHVIERLRVWPSLQTHERRRLVAVLETITDQPDARSNDRSGGP